MPRKSKKHQRGMLAKKPNDRRLEGRIPRKNEGRIFNIGQEERK